MSLPRLRPSVAAGFALTLVLGLGGCGGDDEPEDASSTPGDSSTSEPVGSEPAAEETDVPEGDEAPAGGVVFTTGGGDGVFGVIVGDLDGYTVTNGIDEFFRFDAPGTYEVREDISGNTATVTVE